MTKKTPAKGPRRPAGFWAEFNTWIRASLEKEGKRPPLPETRRWYATRGVEIWPDESIRPTWNELRVHAKCLKPCSAVREYFQGYRRNKRENKQREGAGAAAGGSAGGAGPSGAQAGAPGGSGGRGRAAAGGINVHKGRPQGRRKRRTDTSSEEESSDTTTEDEDDDEEGDDGGDDLTVDDTSKAEGASRAQAAAGAGAAGGPTASQGAAAGGRHKVSGGPDQEGGAGDAEAGVSRAIKPEPSGTAAQLGPVGFNSTRAPAPVAPGASAFAAVSRPDQVIKSEPQQQGSQQQQQPAHSRQRSDVLMQDQEERCEDQQDMSGLVGAASAGLDAPSSRARGGGGGQVPIAGRRAASARGATGRSRRMSGTTSNTGAGASRLAAGGTATGAGSTGPAAGGALGIRRTSSSSVAPSAPSAPAALLANIAIGPAGSARSRGQTGGADTGSPGHRQPSRLSLAMVSPVTGPSVGTAAVGTAGAPTVSGHAEAPQRPTASDGSAVLSRPGLPPAVMHTAAHHYPYQQHAAQHQHHLHQQALLQQQLQHTRLSAAQHHQQQQQVPVQMMPGSQRMMHPHSASMRAELQRQQITQRANQHISGLLAGGLLQKRRERGPSDLGGVLGDASQQQQHQQQGQSHPHLGITGPATTSSMSWGQAQGQGGQEQMVVTGGGGPSLSSLLQGGGGGSHPSGASAPSLPFPPPGAWGATAEGAGNPAGPPGGSVPPGSLLLAELAAGGSSNGAAASGGANVQRTASSTGAAAASGGGHYPIQMLAAQQHQQQLPSGMMDLATVIRIAAETPGLLSNPHSGGGGVNMMPAGSQAQPGTSQFAGAEQQQQVAQQQAIAGAQQVQGPARQASVSSAMAAAAAAAAASTGVGEAGQQQQQQQQPQMGQRVGSGGQRRARGNNSGEFGAEGLEMGYQAASSSAAAAAAGGTLDHDTLMAARIAQQSLHHYQQQQQQQRLASYGSEPHPVQSAGAALVPDVVATSASLLAEVPPATHMGPSSGVLGSHHVPSAPDMAGGGVMVNMMPSASLPAPGAHPFAAAAVSGVPGWQQWGIEAGAGYGHAGGLGGGPMGMRRHSLASYQSYMRGSSGGGALIPIPAAQAQAAAAAAAGLQLGMLFGDEAPVRGAASVPPELQQQYQQQLLPDRPLPGHAALAGAGEGAGFTGGHSRAMMMGTMMMNQSREVGQHGPGPAPRRARHAHRRSASWHDVTQLLLGGVHDFDHLQAPASDPAYLGEEGAGTHAPVVPASAAQPQQLMQQSMVHTQQMPQPSVHMQHQQQQQQQLAGMQPPALTVPAPTSVAPSLPTPTALPPQLGDLPANTPDIEAALAAGVAAAGAPSRTGSNTQAEPTQQQQQQQWMPPPVSSGLETGPLPSAPDASTARAGVPPPAGPMAVAPQVMHPTSGDRLHTIKQAATPGELGALHPTPRYIEGLLAEGRQSGGPSTPHYAAHDDLAMVLQTHPQQMQMQQQQGGTLRLHTWHAGIPHPLGDASGPPGAIVGDTGIVMDAAFGDLPGDLDTGLQQIEGAGADGMDVDAVAQAVAGLEEGGEYFSY